jgi:hypothetical protein
VAANTWLVYFESFDYQNVKPEKNDKSFTTIATTMMTTMSVRSSLVFLVGMSLGWNLRGSRLSMELETVQTSTPPWYSDILEPNLMVWNGQAPLGAPVDCSWTTIPFQNTSLQVCGIALQDDCSYLLPYVDRSSSEDLMLLVGADCVITFLTKTKSSLIVVEPNPKQLYQLTSTLLSFQQQKRVAVVAMAVGPTDGLDVIYGDNANAAYHMTMTRLDSMLTRRDERIALMHVSKRRQSVPILESSQGLANIQTISMQVSRKSSIPELEHHLQARDYQVRRQSNYYSLSTEKKTRVRQNSVVLQLVGISNPKRYVSTSS